jgi:hypothetical protein
LSAVTVNSRSIAVLASDNAVGFLKINKLQIFHADNKTKKEKIVSVEKKPFDLGDFARLDARDPKPSMGSLTPLIALTPPLSESERAFCEHNSSFMCSATSVLVYSNWRGHSHKL